MHTDNKTGHTERETEIHVNADLGDDELNDLFAAAWPHHRRRPFAPILSRSLTHISAFIGGRLVGFVNMAWDGGVHAFLLDTTVHPAHQRHGLGQKLVHRAIAEAAARNIEWLHVDYEAHLAPFYENCGFAPTTAGLLHLPKTT